MHLLLKIPRKAWEPPDQPRRQVLARLRVEGPDDFATLELDGADADTVDVREALLRWSYGYQGHMIEEFTSPRDLAVAMSGPAMRKFEPEQLAGEEIFTSAEAAVTRELDGLARDVVELLASILPRLPTWEAPARAELIERLRLILARGLAATRSTRLTEDAGAAFVAAVRDGLVASGMNAARREEILRETFGFLEEVELRSSETPQQVAAFLRRLTTALEAPESPDLASLMEALEADLTRTEPVADAAVPPEQQGVQRLAALHSRGRRVRDLDLSGTSLAASQLEGLRGDGLRLVGTDLTGAILRRAQLVNCELRDAILARADLASSTLRMCNLDGARGRDTRLGGARIEDSSLEGADFTEAQMQDVRLTESIWTRASLHGANLEAAQGDGVGFRGADLGDASLARASLVDADFRGADLTGADLSQGDFRGADFRGAILDGVRWDGAECSGARFDDDEAPTRPDAAASDARPETGSGDADAIAAALADLVARAVKAPELGKVAAEWESWRSRVGEAGPQDLRGLLASLEGALGDAVGLPPEAVHPLEHLLRLLREADGAEPSEAWTSRLAELFPEIDEAGDASQLEDLAARLVRHLGLDDRG